MNDERTAESAKNAPTAGTAAPANASSAAEQSLMKMLGLARRARKLAVGTDAAIDAVRSGKAAIALVASDASERTRKQLGDQCASYGVTLVTLKADRSALAAALGSKDGQISACAVTDRNMAIKILSLTNT